MYNDSITQLKGKINEDVIHNHAFLINYEQKDKHMHNS